MPTFRTPPGGRGTARDTLEHFSVSVLGSMDWLATQLQLGMNRTDE